MENTESVRGYDYKRAIKAGRLANGWERGKGSIVHLVSERFLYAGGQAVCGERPAIAWSERENHGVTCMKCLREMQQMSK